MPVVSGTTLKTYFETGDRPTQAQFEDLIDSSLQSTTVFGRSGAIVAVSADYTASQISDTATKVIMTATERALLASLSATVLTPSGGDDTAVVQAAMTALAATGGVIEFSAGTFILSAQLTSTCAGALTLRGTGPRQTLLVWTAAASHGINITYTNLIERPEVRDLGLITDSFATGTAL